MKMQINFKVGSVKHDQEKGKFYVKAIDLDKASLIEFSMPDNIMPIEQGDEAEITAEVTPGRGKYGLYLTIDKIIK
jgi:hypothetical protein